MIINDSTIKTEADNMKATLVADALVSAFGAHRVSFTDFSADYSTVLGNAGSFFKNPIVKEAVAERLKSEYEDMPLYPTADPTKRKLAAGWLIDQSGLKGYRTGNVGVHDRQALVLVNHGDATGEEVMALARYVQQTVAAKFGIDIEAEVNVL